MKDSTRTKGKRKGRVNRKGKSWQCKSMDDSEGRQHERELQP